jgi:hypothetical protein
VCATPAHVVAGMGMPVDYLRTIIRAGISDLGGYGVDKRPPLWMTANAYHSGGSPCY